MRATLLALFLSSPFAWFGPVHGAEPEEPPEFEALKHMPTGYMTEPVMISAPALRDSIGEEPLARQYAALKAMPNVRVQYAPNGTVHHLTGSTGLFLDTSGWKPGETAAPDILQKLAAALLARGTEELRLHSVEENVAEQRLGGKPKLLPRFRQFIRGLPVLQSVVNLGIDSTTGEVRGLTSNFLPDRGLQTETQIGPDAARDSLLQELRAETDDPSLQIALTDNAPTLAYAFDSFVDGAPAGPGHLVWVIKVTRQTSKSYEELDAAVSATTGKIIQLFSLVRHALNRQVYSANYQLATIPAGLTFLFGEGGLPPDITSQNAYDNVHTTYTAWLSRFNRDSMDANGGPIKIAVHRVPFPGLGAYDPFSNFLIFHEGDANTKAAGDDLETVAHEYGHGIADAAGKMGLLSNAFLDAEAIHEGFGDFSALVADVHSTGGVITPQSWSLIHLSKTNPTQGRRYWNSPILGGLWYRDWYPTRSLALLSENSAYFNSTIFGHAFYLLVNGGSHNRAGLPLSGVPVIPVPQIGFQQASDVFYGAMVHETMFPEATFFDYRYSTIQVSSTNSPVMQAVGKAWDAVGVGYGCTAPPSVPSIFQQMLYCPWWRISLGYTPGATTFNIQYSASHTFQQPVTGVDSPDAECEIWPSATMYVRGRACNGCGCSGWSSTEAVVPWAGECP